MESSHRTGVVTSAASRQPPWLLEQVRARIRRFGLVKRTEGPTWGGFGVSFLLTESVIREWGNGGRGVWAVVLLASDENPQHDGADIRHLSS